MITAELNASVHFSCASPPEHSLALCVWERNKDGQRESMVIDKIGEEEGGGAFQTVFPSLAVGCKTALVAS